MIKQSPGNIESTGKRKSGRVTKGKVYLKTMLVEFAHGARRTDSVFKVKFQFLVGRIGFKRAIIAVAHKMCHTIKNRLTPFETLLLNAADFTEIAN